MSMSTEKTIYKLFLFVFINDLPFYCKIMGLLTQIINNIIIKHIYCKFVVLKILNWFY